MRQKTNKNKQKMMMRMGATDKNRKSKEKLNTSQNNNANSQNKNQTKTNDIGVIPLYDEKQNQKLMESPNNNINMGESQSGHNNRDNIDSSGAQKRENFDDISKQAIDKHIEKLDFDKMKKAQLAVLPRTAAQDEEGNAIIIKKNDFQLMSLDIEQLQKQIKALDPHFTTSTTSKTINELNITPDEYLRYNQYLLSLQETNGYLLQHISLVEFVLHDRLKRLSSATIEDQTDKDSYKKFTLEQFQEMRNHIKDPSRNKLLELKRMLNFVLQNDVNKDIGSNYYDLENYEEEENDQHQTVEEVWRKAMPSNNFESDNQNPDQIGIENNAEKMMLKDFNNQVMNRHIIFKPTSGGNKLIKSESTRNVSFGMSGMGLGETSTTNMINQNDALVMQNILKGNVRIIRGVGTEENDPESSDKIKQIFGGSKRLKSRGVSSRKSPNKSDTSKMTITTSDRQSDNQQTLQSRNKLRVMLKRNQTVPMNLMGMNEDSKSQNQNFDQQRSRMNLVKNNYSERTLLKTPLQQDIEQISQQYPLNEDLLLDTIDKQPHLSTQRFNPIHLDQIEEQTEDEIYPSTCLALPQRRQTIQHIPHLFTLQAEKGLYKDETLLESPNNFIQNDMPLTLQKQLSNIGSDQLESNLSSSSPHQQNRDDIIKDDDLDQYQTQTKMDHPDLDHEDIDDQALQKFTYQGIYQPVDKPYLKELNKKKNRNRFINRPVAVSSQYKSNTDNNHINNKIGSQGIAVQKLKQQQLSEEEQRYIRRMLGLNNNLAGNLSATKVIGNSGDGQILYQKGKILEQLNIPPPTSN